MKNIMTAHEVASYLRISYWKVLELAKQGGIPHCRIGRKILFRLDVLNTWIDKQEA